MNLFGESMNLFEMGGRVEGLESLLESYFGPVGYYNDENKGSNEIPDTDPRHAGLSKKKMNDIRNKVSFYILFFMYICLCICFFILSSMVGFVMFCLFHFCSFSNTELSAELLI